jgi:PEP-CTERM motif
MKRAILTLLLLVLLLLAGVRQARADILLTFNSPVPGTIADVNGHGTGFPTRLPGTGAALPPNDPNLQLAAGHLLITSTHTDLNYGGVNLGVAEAPGVFLPGIGNRDFVASMLVQGIQVPHGSDQLLLYAGTSSGNTLRGGLHDGNVYILVENNAGTGNLDSLLFISSANAFAPGDDVALSLKRESGIWSLAWNDLSNPSASGQSPGFDVSSLNTATSLYVGVYAADAGTAIPQTNQLDYFFVSANSGPAVPEPSTLALIGIGVAGLLGYSWRSRKQTKADLSKPRKG